MATGFCPKCGSPLSPGAQFCSNCGSPLPTASDAEATSSIAEPFSPPPAERPLAVLLGVQNTRRFLLQHLLIGPKHSYRVMNVENVRLFTVGENLAAERQARWDNFVHPARPGEPRFKVTWGAASVPPQVDYWGLEDFAGNLRGALSLEIRRGQGTATLTDAAGATVLTVAVTRHPTSITAEASDATGRPILEARGDLFHLHFSIHDVSGAEVARVHEAAASLRDTYTLDLVGNVDAVHAAVFTILVDHYKGH